MEKNKKAVEEIKKFKCFICEKNSRVFYNKKPFCQDCFLSLKLIAKENKRNFSQNLKAFKKNYKKNLLISYFKFCPKCLKKTFHKIINKKSNRQDYYLKCPNCNYCSAWELSDLRLFKKNLCLIEN